jgi:REP element-mobilizing transposase RayT
MKVSPDKPRHASASYRLCVRLLWPTKYRKHVPGEKLTPVVESKILEVCATNQYQLFVPGASVDHLHVLLGMRPMPAVSDVVRDIESNSSAVAFPTFSSLSEIIKWMSYGQRDIVLSPSVLVIFRRSSATSSTRPGIMGKVQISSQAGCETRRLWQGRAQGQRSPSP